MNSPPTISSILGEPRYRPLLDTKPTTEPLPSDDKKAYTYQFRLAAVTGRAAFKLGKAALVALGENLSKLLAGGGIDIEGEVLTMDEAREAFQGFDLKVLSGIMVACKGIDDEELFKLITHGLAGYLSFRVAVHGIEDEPPDDLGEWHLIAEDEHAAEVLDDVMPSASSWLSMWLTQLRTSVLPISRALFTNAGSRGGATPSTPEDDTSSKTDSPS